MTSFLILGARALESVPQADYRRRCPCGFGAVNRTNNATLSFSQNPLSSGFLEVPTGECAAEPSKFYSRISQSLLRESTYGAMRQSMEVGAQPR
jgi:hypothetical protein